VSHYNYNKVSECFSSFEIKLHKMMNKFGTAGSLFCSKIGQPPIERPVTRPP